MKFLTTILFAAVIATQASAIELATSNSTAVTTTTEPVATVATATAEVNTTGSATTDTTNTTEDALDSINDPFDDGQKAVEEESTSGSGADGPNVGDESSFGSQSGSHDNEAGFDNAGVSVKSLTLGVSAVVVTLAAALF